MADKGQVAYEAWAKATDAKPTWEDLGDGEQEIWVAVEEAVLEAEDDDDDEDDSEDEKSAA